MTLPLLQVEPSTNPRECRLVNAMGAVYATFADVHPQAAQILATAPQLLAACELVAEAMRGGDYEVAFKAVHAAIAQARVQA